MVNAGRVLIMPQGDWSSLEPYQMLDLVTYNKTAYLARKASVGVNPQTDVQKVYWQPFGTAVEIATTEKPGIVMPDGTTITISQTGVIEAHLILGEAEDVDIVKPQNGQVLAYSSILDAWQNKSLGTAASKDSTSDITEDSEDLIESGAIHVLKQTLETALTNKADTSTVNTALASKADKSDLASISITGTTNNTGSTISKGTYFYLNNTLVQAKASIASGATLTLNTNYEEVTAGGLNAINDVIITRTINDTTLTITSQNAQDIVIDTIAGYTAIAVNLSLSGTGASASPICIKTANNVQRIWVSNITSNTITITVSNITVIYAKTS